VLSHGVAVHCAGSGLGQCSGCLCLHCSKQPWALSMPFAVKSGATAFGSLLLQPVPVWPQSVRYSYRVTHSSSHISGDCSHSSQNISPRPGRLVAHRTAGLCPGARAPISKQCQGAALPCHSHPPYTPLTPVPRPCHPRMHARVFLRHPGLSLALMWRTRS
jgi:hypothetical protein